MCGNWCNHSLKIKQLHDFTTAFHCIYLSLVEMSQMVNHQPAEQMFMMKLTLAWQAWQREKSHRYVIF